MVNWRAQHECREEQRGYRHAEIVGARVGGPRSGPAKETVFLGLLRVATSR